MAKYTEQEIEMLARHMWETDVFSPSWSEASDEQREQARSCIRRGNADPRITEAAARLMREAREQGAAEMRERAAHCARHAFHRCGSSLAMEAEMVALPLTVPQ